LMRARTPDDDTMNAIRRLTRPLQYLASREIAHESRRPHARHLLMELKDILESDLKTTSTDVTEDGPEH